MYHNPFAAGANYAGRLAQMEQMYTPPQTGAIIQNIQSMQTAMPQAQCFFVNAKDDIQNIQINPNTVYIGINRQAKEVYLRSWNNDGMIDFDVYALSEGKKEKDDMKTIMDKLENIEKKLKDKENEYISKSVDQSGDVGDVAKQSADGLV